MSEFAELHDELRSIAADLLAKADAGVAWTLLAQAGWTGLEVPGRLDGAEATFRETAVILTEIGRAAARTGYLGGTLAVGALLAARPSDARDELLAGIAAGSVTAAAALSADHQSASPSAPFTVSSASSGWRVQGSSRFVPDGGAAVVLLLAQDPSGEPVAAVVPSDTAGLTVTPQPVTDETRDLDEVIADDVTVEARWVLRFAGEPQAALRLLADRAATAVALDSLGLSEAMLARTVSYVGLREQFGRPIGSFQAVKHACADMLVQIAVARQLVHGAVEAVATAGPDGDLAASKAKAFVSESAVEIAGKALQLHGGIGYTWESGVPAYLKRATLNRALFGSPAAHRHLIAQRYLD
jgi:alkylation response protein AidB-like acyl-CoA dehydrogenase